MIDQTPAGQTIEYNEKYFTYKHVESGRKLKSVSAIINQFFPGFDKETWAKKCAGNKKYPNMTPEQVIKFWDDKANKSRSEGDNVHAYAEALFKRQANPPDPISDRAGNLFKSVDRAYVLLKKNFAFVDAEKIVFSPELGIATRIDLIMRDKENGEYLVIDWKNNESISMQAFKNEKAFAPIGHVENCDFIKYSLQLSLGGYICLHEKYYPSPIRYGLVHLRENAMPDNIRVQPLYKEVEAILDHIRPKENEKLF